MEEIALNVEILGTPWTVFVERNQFVKDLLQNIIGITKDIEAFLRTNMGIDTTIRVDELEFNGKRLLRGASIQNSGLHEGCTVMCHQTARQLYTLYDANTCIGPFPVVAYSLLSFGIVTTHAPDVVLSFYCQPQSVYRFIDRNDIPHIILVHQYLDRYLYAFIGGIQSNSIESFYQHVMRDSFISSFEYQTFDFDMDQEGILSFSSLESARSSIQSIFSASEGARIEFERSLVLYEVMNGNEPETAMDSIVCEPTRVSEIVDALEKHVPDDLKHQWEALKGFSVCAICHENVANISYGCGHKNCFTCFQKLQQNNMKCALCRSNINEISRNVRKLF